MELEWHSKTLGNGEWEDLRAPIDCSYYQIMGNFSKCSDVNDENTCRVFTDGFAVVCAFAHNVKSVRWAAGDHITWVKSSTPLDLFFLR